MKKMAQSFMSFFLAAWILFGSLGISWTEATCVYTGAKKFTVSKAESCCKPTSQAQLSRAKCCFLGKYQVKFNFDLTKGNTALQWVFTPASTAVSYQSVKIVYQEIDNFNLFQANAPPLTRQVRLAQLQTYLI
ncbi:MAG: hypothetical protein RLZZ474_1100 [Bacteroidota bacterium]